MAKRLKLGRILIVLLVLFLIILGITYIYKNNSNKDVYTYKGINGDTYTFNIDREGNLTFHIIRVYSGNQEFFIPLRYGPNELQDIPLDTTARAQVTESKNGMKSTIYITQDPELVNKTEQMSALAVVEINKVTGQAQWGIYKIPTITAVTVETESSKKLELPKIDCGDASDSIGVIKLVLGNENRIYLEKPNCVVIEGIDGYNLFKVTDKFVLHLLGVF